MRRCQRNKSFIYSPNSIFIIFLHSILIIYAFISFISGRLYLAYTHSFCLSSKIEVVYVMKVFIEFMNDMVYSYIFLEDITIRKSN
jgi:hypothetical protein